MQPTALLGKPSNQPLRGWWGPAASRTGHRFGPLALALIALAALGAMRPGVPPPRWRASTGRPAGGRGLKHESNQGRRITRWSGVFGFASIGVSGTGSFRPGQVPFSSCTKSMRVVAGEFDSFSLPHDKPTAIFCIAGLVRVVGRRSDGLERKARVGEAGSVASGVGERSGTRFGLKRDAEVAVRTHRSHRGYRRAKTRGGNQGVAGSRRRRTACSGHRA